MRKALMESKHLVVVIHTLWADSESQGRGQASGLAQPFNIQQDFLHRGPGKPVCIRKRF